MRTLPAGTCHHSNEWGPWVVISSPGRLLIPRLLVLEEKAEAFIYGFPLVFGLAEVGRFARTGMGGVPATPFNRFGQASQLAGPEATFVSINNDTVY